MLHPISFGNIEELLKQNMLENNRKYILLADQNTFKCCYPKISHLIPEENCVVIEAGENNKNVKNCEKVWSFLSEKQADRHSALICLGGGMVGDLGGFCAATFKRGMPFVLIPTSLLAMVDASIGGKTAVDFQFFKNQLGAFHLPEQVLIDTTFLNTLDSRQIHAGKAEMWKHILIHSPSQATKLFEYTIDLLSEESIKHSTEIKLEIVTKDPKEKNIRKQLNLGHTLGHAIESVYLETETPLLHGEAVFAGLWLEQYCANKLGLFPDNQWNLLSSAIKANLPELDLMEHQDKILFYLKQDKKNKNDNILFVLLREIGHCIWDVEIKTELILESLKNYPLLRCI